MQHTYLLNQLPSDGVEQCASTTVCSNRLVAVDLVRGLEERPAEFHPSLDVSRIRSNDPIKDRPQGLDCYLGLGLSEHEDIKGCANLCIPGLGEPVERVEVK